MKIYFNKKVLTINLIIFIEAPSKRIRFICGTPSLFGTYHKYAKRIIKMLVRIAKRWNLRPICNIIMERQSCSSVFYIKCSEKKWNYFTRVINKSKYVLFFCVRFESLQYQDELFRASSILKYKGEWYSLSQIFKYVKVQCWINENEMNIFIQYLKLNETFSLQVDSYFTHQMASFLSNIFI